MIEELMAKSQSSRNKGFRISGKSVGQPAGFLSTKKIQPEKEILQSFYNTTVEHENLRRKRQNSKGEIIKHKTGKQLIQEMMETREDLKDGFQSEQEKLNKLKEEVKALPDILKPNPNPRTYNMILEQKKMRRKQHLEELKGFEAESLRVRSEGTAKIDSLKKDIETFLKDQQTSADDYFTKVDDEQLVKMEDEVIDILSKYRDRKNLQLTEKLANVDKQLDQFEEEFLRDIENTVEGLRFTLVDIAFKLEPEVNDIITEIRDTFKQDIEDGKARNKEYFEGLTQQVKALKDAIAQRTAEKIARWRLLKHNEAIENHIKDINKADYQEPIDRKLQIAAIDAYMDITIEKRMVMIKDLYSIPAAHLGPQHIQTYLDGLTTLDEQVQATIDEHVNKLMKMKDECLTRIEKLIDHTKARIVHYDADLSVACPETPTHEQLFNHLFKEEHQRLVSYHNKILEEVVNFVESRDKACNDVAIQVGRCLKHFSLRLTKFSNDQAESKNKYELVKAKLEDDNNEKLELLTKDLDEAKANLRRAKDHKELDERLALCFQAVDTIEAEFRVFHEQNKEVISKHLPFIEEVFAVLTNDVLNLLALIDPSRQAELEQLYDKVAKYKAKLKTDLFIKERDEREQRELEDLLEKNKDNKKFKPPKPKAVDPKKAAQEWQDLFNKTYAELKRPVKEMLVKETGTKRLVQKSIKAYCTAFYQPVKPELTEEEKAKLEQERVQKEKEEQERKAKEEEEAKKKKGAPKPTKPQQEEAVIEAAEDPEDVEIPKMAHQLPVYYDQVPLFTKEYTIDLQFLVGLEDSFRGQLFDYIGKLKTLRVTEADQEDQQFIETSLALLDERLKRFYSMKGKIQIEIFSIRSGEIGIHKKKYELEVKACLDDIDNQTAEFNKVYKALFDQKEGHTKTLEGLIASLGQQSSLAALQGVLNAAKDKDFKWSEQSAGYVNDLRYLGSKALDLLLKENESRIKNKTLLEKGGEYSSEEVAWYSQMLAEINDKIEEHRKKRTETTQAIEELAKKRKEEIFKKFTDAYDVALDDLAARNSTGKIFGKPRRAAQEIVRSEISLCIRADQTLNKMVEDLSKIVAQFDEGSLPSSEIEALWSTIRQKLMAFRNCSFFFGRYIAAFNEKSPLEEMPRVTYIEDSLDVKLKEAEKKEDDLRRTKELAPLDQIYYRGDKIRFLDRIKDMENVVIAEAAKLYVQQYAHFLKPDKMTDVLRVFVASLRKEMEDFRLDAIRQLRTVTENFNQIAAKATKTIFDSLRNRFEKEVSARNSAVSSKWNEVFTTSESLKEAHIKLLRPNLAHPYNLKDKEKLYQQEENRIKLIFTEIESRKAGLTDCYHSCCNAYFQRSLNSFYFLCLYFDNCLLQEDYVRLPGDEEVVKEHLSLKKLMIMQKKGELKDTSSLRSITKRWKTFALDLFQIEGKTFEFKDVTHVYRSWYRSIPRQRRGRQRRQLKRSLKILKEKMQRRQEELLRLLWSKNKVRLLQWPRSKTF
jgi:hypothetical protein